MTLSLWTLLLQALLVVLVAMVLFWLGRGARALLRPIPAYSSRAELEADYQNARIDVGRYLMEKDLLRR